MKQGLLIFLAAILVAAPLSYGQELLGAVPVEIVSEVSQGQEVPEEEAPAAVEQSDTAITGDFIHKEEKGYYYITYPSDDGETIARTQDILQKTFQGRIEYYIHPHTYLVYGTEREIKKLEKKGVIVSSSEYDYLEHISLASLDGGEDLLFHLFKTADAEHIAERIEDVGGEVRRVHERLIEASLDPDLIFELKVIGIASIEVRPEYELYNQKSNVISGITATRQLFNIYGEGEIITVLDGGLDTGVIGPSMHDDFDGRIVSLTDMYSGLNPVNSDKCVDFDSHGTHVAGIALANGILSGSNPPTKSFESSYAGSVPAARLVMQCAGGSQGTSFIAPTLLYAFTTAQSQGSYIHSNSWGTNTFGGSYNARSYNLDNYILNNKEFNAIFAAGNNLGPTTITPPATSKNGIGVSGHWRDDLNQHAGAEGPTLDGRFKPDILAPSHGNPLAQPLVNIISTMSSQQVPFPIGCQVGPLAPYYCESGGTSMAAPRVAGGVAIIRQYWQNVRNHNPSAALVKATLLNGGQALNGYPVPNVRDGWGRMDLSVSLPQNPNDLAFVDWPQGLQTGEKKTYQIRVGPNNPFVLTLAWTDQPGCVYPACPFAAVQLVNDLDLVITDPQGNKYMGNDIVAPYDDQVDTLNNVEQVQISQSVDGIYTIDIKASNIPLGMQDFAFVVLHEGLQAQQLCRLPNGALC